MFKVTTDLYAKPPVIKVTDHLGNRAVVGIEKVVFAGGGDHEWQLKLPRAQTGSVGWMLCLAEAIKHAAELGRSLQLAGFMEPEEDRRCGAIGPPSEVDEGNWICDRDPDHAGEPHRCDDPDGEFIVWGPSSVTGTRTRKTAVPKKKTRRMTRRRECDCDTCLDWDESLPDTAPEYECIDCGQHVTQKEAEDNGGICTDGACAGSLEDGPARK